MYRLYYENEFIESFEDLEGANNYINNAVEEDTELDTEQIIILTMP